MSEQKTATRFAATHDEYHASPGHSASRFRLFDSDPIEFYHVHVAKDWRPKPPTESMEFGTQIHLLAEHRFQNRQIVADIPADVLSKSGSRAGAAWKAWEAEHAGMIHLKPGEQNPFAIIKENLRGHDDAWWLVDNDAAEREVNVRWVDAETGLMCRSRLDLVSRGVIVDYKTTGKMSHRECQTTFEHYKYHQQLAFYQRAWYELTGEIFPCVVIAIGNVRPWAVAAYEIDQSWIDRGRVEMDAIMTRYMDCEASGNWIPDDHKVILKMGEPKWAAYQDDFRVED